MTATTSIRRDGTSLIGWLRLVGWRVEIMRTGREWSGTARFMTREGEELRIARNGSGYRDVVSELYRGALGSLAL